MLNRTLSHYRIVERLNESAMGEVYKAVDLLLQRTVALKFLSPSILSEARAAAAVNHPNIAAVYGVEQAEDLSFIVMEYVEGETLAERIKRKPFEIAEAIDISIRIADALRSMHEKGFIHCDVKSANIMAAPDGNVKMLDFGLARLSRRSAPEQAEVGTVSGTIGYMSPEQARGEALDARTDLFSLGIVIYEMTTGRLPFEGESAAALQNSLLKDEPAAIGRHRKDAPLEFEDIVRRALEKNRNDRCRSAEEFLSDLRRLKDRLEQGAAYRENEEKRSSGSASDAQSLWSRLFESLGLKEAEAASPISTGTAFRGLLPFQEADRDRFYGREVETQKLFEMISHREYRFGALFGESGCGKTSLVKAGLAPKLWEEGYVPVYCRSYKDPLAAVVDECRKQHQIDLGKDETPTDYLLRVAEELGGEIIIIFDQFEEFFINFRSEQEREPFVSFVAGCYRKSDLPAKFLFSIRSDFLYLINSEFADKIPDPLMSSRLCCLRCFGEKQAEQIIEKSARRADLKFEEGLCRQAARDLAENGSVLPSELQIVGEQLQAKRIFTLQEYRRAGGKEPLVHAFLEDVIQASADKECAQLLLRSLISEENTRLTLPLDEIVKRTQRSRQRTEQILKLFVGSRLIREIQEEEPWRYELMHEYLIEKINQITGRVMDAVQRANRLFRQYLSSYSIDKQTQIPLSKLWTIKRYSDLKQGERERELLKKSLQRGLIKGSGILILLTIAAVVSAAMLSISEEWDGVRFNDGHKAIVRRVALSPNGRLLVSGGEDNTVIVWDFAKREQLAVFKDHTGIINAVAFSPDGKRFATGSDDKTVIVWNAERLEKIAVLRDHKYRVFDVAFTPDGRFLVSMAQGRLNASGISDEPIILWETDQWKKTGELFLGPLPNNIILSPDGRRLIHPNGKVWELATGKPIADAFVSDAESGLGSSYEAVLSPDASRVAAVDPNGFVYFADPIRRKIFSQSRAHEGIGHAVAFSPDGRLVATAADKIILWDAATQTKLAPLAYTSGVWDLAFSPDGRQLVSSHEDGSILVWDVAERELITNFNEHSGPVSSVAFSFDGKRLVSASEDKSAIVWNVESGRKEATLEEHKMRLTAAVFSPDGKWIASSDYNESIIVWDWKQRLPKWAEHNRTNYSLTFSPDGRRLATSSGVYDSVEGRKIVSLLENHYEMAFSDDGRRLACVSGNEILLWDAENWKLIERYWVNNGGIVNIAFSPDGKQLVTGEDKGILRLWSIEPIREEGLLGRHDARVKSVAFSPDGKQIASSSDDRTIALWDVRSRSLVARIGSHTGSVHSIAFSPDGKKLASGEQDGAVRIYTRRRSLWGYNLD